MRRWLVVLILFLSIGGMDGYCSISPSWLTTINVEWDLSDGLPEARKVLLDVNGSIYVVGDGPDRLLLGLGDGVYRDEVFRRVRRAKVEVPIFIIKLNGEGKLKWFKSIGENSYTCYGISDAEVSSDGSIYLTGYLYSSLPSRDVNIQAFIAKLDEHGNISWFRVMDIGMCDFGLDLAMDSHGDIYMLGLTAHQPLKYQNFLVKLNSRGVLQWFRLFKDIYGARGVFTNSEGVHIYGLMSECAFVAKLDYDGNVEMLREIGGNGFYSPSSVAVDINGNIYLTGSFYKLKDTLEQSCIFVIKLDPKLNPIWTRAFNFRKAVKCTCTWIDGEMNIYIAGCFSNALERDIFITKLDVNGDVTWSRALNISGANYVRGMAIDKGGNVYLCGLAYELRQIFVTRLLNKYILQKKLSYFILTDGENWERIEIKLTQQFIMECIININIISTSIPTPFVVYPKLYSLSLESTFRLPETHMAVVQSFSDL